MSLSGLPGHPLEKRDRLRGGTVGDDEREQLIEEKAALVKRLANLNSLVDDFFDNFDLSKKEICDLLVNKSDAKESATKDNLLQALYSETFDLM